MNLTVEQYKKYKLVDKMSDQDILELMGKSRTSKRSLQTWKRLNNVPLGNSKVQLLDKKLIRKQLETHSIRWTAFKHKIEYNTFRLWVYTWIYKEEN